MSAFLRENDLKMLAIVKNIRGIKKSAGNSKKTVNMLPASRNYFRRPTSSKMASSQ